MEKHVGKILTGLAALALISCGIEAFHNDPDKLDVFASCYPVYDLLKQVGGDAINAYMLPSPGLEPHEYEPTPGDFGKLYDSDLFVTNGLGMEPWFDTLQSNAGTKEAKALVKRTVVLGNSLGDHVEKIEGVVDPHAWLSTVNASIYLESIAGALSQFDPDNAAIYERNLFAAKNKMTSLHGEIASALEGVENKKLVVSHAAFGYFANEFGLEQIYLSGLASEEPTVRDVERVIEEIQDNNISTVYAEELSGDDTLTRIQQETGCAIKELHTLETLTKEEMNDGEDYYSIMRGNVATLLEEGKA